MIQTDARFRLHNRDGFEIRSNGRFGRTSNEIINKIAGVRGIGAELVDFVNLNGGFKAKRYSNFEGKSKSQLSSHLGAVIPPAVSASEISEAAAPSAVEVEAATSVAESSTGIPLPANYSALEAHPECNSTIGKIQDQSQCGSCWAVSTASAITDRRCIASGGAVTAQLSAWDLIACCGEECGYGCDGGYTTYAATYFEQIGLVTGSDYVSDVGCMPYEVRPCDTTCPTQPENITCSPACQSGYAKTYAQDKQIGGKAYTAIFEDPVAMQEEIMARGSVVAQFDVYEDFYNYESGVYKYVSGDYSGGHAVRVIGWGTEDGEDYWLVANSWGTWWGMDGYFKIARGVDECGFESYVVATNV